MHDAPSLHAKRLSGAATNILQPMGLTQRRAQMWIDDHAWWICIAEFQPGEWSRGIYLNVGCMWLWQLRDVMTFDEGHRVASSDPPPRRLDHHSDAERLAEIAADEVHRYRTRFASSAAVAHHYLEQQSPGFWTSFHAGMACALAGYHASAADFFNRVITNAAPRSDAMHLAALDAERVSSILGNLDHIRFILARRIQQIRVRHQLPTTVTIDFGPPAYIPAAHASATRD